MIVLCFSSLSFLICSIGSFPGVRIRSSGVWYLLSLKASLTWKMIGVTKNLPSDFWTYLLIAAVVSSGLMQRMRGIQAKCGSVD